MNEEKPAYRLGVAEVLASVGSDATRGLTGQEAASRLARDGPNELAARPPTPNWRRFLAQFKDVLVVLLLVATVASTGLWFFEGASALPYEALAIMGVVLLNALLGFVHESRAESAVAALRQMAAAQARVIRDGIPQRVPSVEVVIGDLIVIEEGDTIPADARVTLSTSLHAAEAVLTGESLPVSKNIEPIDGAAGIGDRHNLLFSGTAAAYGRGRAVVVATGMRTEMGRIAGMLEDTPDEITPLQRQLNRVGRLLGLVVVALAAVMILTIVMVEDVRGMSALVDVLILGVALAVAAVPEGLPAVVTAVLAMGVQRMARRRAIVRRLAAVETLGSADVIASDKTGTLTKNEMTVRSVVTASGELDVGGIGYAPTGDVRRADGGEIDDAFRFELQRTLAVADRANNASLHEDGGRWSVRGDPTEGALIVAARKAGLSEATLSDRFERVGEVPFSSDRKLMSTVHTDTERSDQLRIFSKGAPDVLLARCTHELVGREDVLLDDVRRRRIVDANEALAERALRTLGVAYRTVPARGIRPDEVDDRIEHDLVFAGLVGMIDPPRDEVRDAVSRAKGAGIRPIMITGDHPKTAVVIARELGIAGEGAAVTGQQLEAMDEHTLDRTVTSVSVYARVNPEHKLRIVRALQRQGATVAMTGDGVNDAPALKTADIGIAMGIAGTDVAKEAADMVLADDNFASIVSAVEEGRAIVANIRKFLRYLLSSNIGEVMTMFLGVLLARAMGLREASDAAVVLPLLATQLLWINLVTDGAPALALGVDPADEDVMLRRPRPKGESILSGSMWAGIVFVGAVMAVSTLYVLDASLPGGFVEGTGTLPFAQTMAFTTLMLGQLFNVLNARSDDRSAFAHLFENRWLWAAIGLSLALHVAVLEVPFMQQAFSTVSLTLNDWFRCVIAASAVLWCRELWKVCARARG